MDMCINATNSLCCTPEINTTLKINYTSIKNKNIKKDAISAATLTLSYVKKRLSHIFSSFTDKNIYSSFKVPGIYQSCLFFWLFHQLHFQNKDAMTYHAQYH